MAAVLAAACAKVPDAKAGRLIGCLEVDCCELDWEVEILRLADCNELGGA